MRAPELLGAALVAFVITAAGGPVLIPFLKRLKCGQTVRDDGPASHLKKDGTPTMGGLLILTGITAVSLFYIHTDPQVSAMLFMILGFGLVGFWMTISRSCAKDLWASGRGRNSGCSFW